MKLYLAIVVTLLFSAQMPAVEQFYHPGPFTWTENYKQFGHDFENSFVRTCYAPANFMPGQKELFHTVVVYEPFSKIKHTSKMNGKTIFDVVYDVEEFGFRVNPKRVSKSSMQTHLIVAGDSNSFGYGVDVEHTLPELMAARMPGSHPYNFSIPGRGPNNVLGIMQLFPWNQLVRESKGLFIFNYYDFLLERVIGEKEFLATAFGDIPWYEVNSDEKIEYRGNFSDRFLTDVFKWIKKKPWLDDFLPVLPRYRRHHSYLLAKLFLQMQEEYLKFFPEGKFVVVVNYFSYGYVPERLNDLVEELKANNIAYVEVYKDQKEKRSPKFMFGDRHLNIEGHKKEAEMILEVLSLNKIIR